MKRKIKITIISPSLHSGGIERVLTMLANDFVHRGFKVQFIACLPKNHFYELDPRILFSEPDYQGRKVFRYTSLLFFLRKEVKRFNPNSVMVFGDYFSSIAQMALLGTGYKVFVADQMSPTKSFPLPIVVLKKIFYPYAAGIIAQTELSAEYHKKRYGNKINVQVIANPMSEMLQVSIPKEKIIAVVARMHNDKGIDIALDVWSKVKNKGEWKMVFAGGGELLEQMKKYAQDLGIYSEVVFLGESKEVPNLLAKSQIFLLSSRGEGFPNALCEAMASGLTCVCFEKLNNSMIITKNEWDGILVPNDDKTEMARQIELLMEDDIKRDKIGENAKGIIKRLDINVIAPQFLEFILN